MYHLHVLPLLDLHVIIIVALLFPNNTNTKDIQEIIMIIDVIVVVGVEIVRTRSEPDVAVVLDTVGAEFVEEGGRTGLTAIVVGILFLLSLFFWPLAALPFQTF